MTPIDLHGKTGVVFGVANHSSIAWAIAQALHDAGVNLAVVYQSERLKDRVEKLVEGWDNVTLLECDVTDDANIKNVFEEMGKRFGSLSIAIHSVAYAHKEDLDGEFSSTSRK